ncbi:MAG: hypothetical protein ACREQI_01490 [Candidatus Binataceae bacterium]
MRKYVLTAIVAAALVVGNFAPPAHADDTAALSAQNTVGGPYVNSYVQAQLVKNASTLNFAWDPTGQSGLLAVADIITYGGSAPAIAPPNGWTLIRDDSAPESTRQTLYWHVMNSDDPATLQWSFGQPVDAQGAIVMVDRASEDSPIDGNTGNSGSGWLPLAKSVTTNGDGDLVLSFYSTNFDGPAAPGPVFPDNVAPIVNEQSLTDAYWVLGGYQGLDGSAGDILCNGVQLYDWVAAEVAIAR